jgi:hypothetical protein
MSPQVVTTNAVVLCVHGGPGTSTPSTDKWSVNGALVLVENDTGTLACPFVPNPCIGYQLRSMGLNASEIDSRKVILVTDFNQSYTGLPLTITESHQMFDDSTTASIPNGESAPPLPAELANLVPPTVTAIPAALAFSLTTQQPATLMAAFTLSATHPLQWVLTLINGTAAVSQDLTNGGIGLIVSPSGGSWNSAVQVVTLTMTLAFLSGLAAGVHTIYMTGVNRRGLSAYATLTLTVSA